MAVVGSGPSGLTIAFQLARRGYPVTIFERESVAGGMLRLGIPDYRLPPEIINADLNGKSPIDFNSNSKAIASIKSLYGKLKKLKEDLFDI